jgi:hypothetical protein
VKEELERMQKEVFVTNVNTLSWHLPHTDSGKALKKTYQDSLCPDGHQLSHRISVLDA